MIRRPEDQLVLVGLHLYSGNPSAMRRQQHAVRAVTALPGVEAVNVQFQREPWAMPGIETLSALTTDSIGVVGPGGNPKPVTRDVFDALWMAAAARRHDYFAFINSDVVILPAAIEAITRERRDTHAISRHDVDNIDDDSSAGTVLTSGLDMFVVSVEWWRHNRYRFRPYIVGDACWDVVYGAVMMCHSSGVVLNHDRLILHERHSTAWNDATLTARYNGFLAALDARYFWIWCQYWERLQPLRKAGGSAAEEQALQDEMFVWRRSLYEAAKQSLRSIRARIRYRSIRRQLTERTPGAGVHVPAPVKK